jgi:hypothetical protein
MDRVSGRSLAARLFGSSPARTLALLQAAWPQAVGPELARRTSVMGVERGTLRVRVPDAAWRKVLHRLQPQILARLREVAGELAPSRLGFLEGGGAEEAVARPSPPRAGGADVAPLPAPVAAEAGHIEDDEIRSRFVQAAARYLARQKDDPCVRP